MGFLSAVGNPFAKAAADTSGRMGIDWGIYGVPETFVIDGKGVIRAQHIGAIGPQDVADMLVALQAAR